VAYCLNVVVGWRSGVRRSLNQINMCRAIICQSSGAKDCGHSNVAYCPNVVVGWRSGVRRSLNQINMCRAIICQSSGAKDCGHSNVAYCPNVVVGWRSGMWWRRLCVRCEGCCSSNIPHTEHIVYATTHRTSNLLQH